MCGSLRQGAAKSPCSCGSRIVFYNIATDALRSMRLELEGYDVTALELIDPDETPKNVMLRAVRTAKPKTSDRSAYDEICAGLSVKPYLDVLLTK